MSLSCTYRANRHRCAVPKICQRPDDVPIYVKFTFFGDRPNESIAIMFSVQNDVDRELILGNTHSDINYMQIQLTLWKSKTCYHIIVCCL